MELPCLAEKNEESKIKKTAELYCSHEGDEVRGEIQNWFSLSILIHEVGIVISWLSLFCDIVISQQGYWTTQIQNASESNLPM